MSTTTEEHTMVKIVAEKVTQNVEERPGQYGTETFWIAYPEHVAGYGHTGDRISRAWGRGQLRREALAAAAGGRTLTAHYEAFGNGQWQAAWPPERVVTDDPEFEVVNIASNQNVLEGTGWRVRLTDETGATVAQFDA